MKLHLPHRLRAAVLAALTSIPALFGATLATATLAGGCLAVLAPAAQAQTITYNGGAIVWSDGSTIGGFTFSNGDDIIFTGDTEATLGGNVTLGTALINSDTLLDLEGGGSTLTGSLIVNGELILRDQALATTAILTTSTGGAITIDWGDTAGTLQSQLASFTGDLCIQDSTYNLTATNYNVERTILHGASTLNLAAGTYAKPLYAVGANIVNVTGNAFLTANLYGNGTLTKTGSGSLLLSTSDSDFIGSLVIEQGTVYWGPATTGNTIQQATNRMNFRQVAITGGTFNDGHTGAGMQNQVDVYLNGGTITSGDMKAPFNSYDSMTENYYKSLTVEGTTGNTMGFSFKGARRFAEVTSVGEATLTVNNGTQYTRTKFDLVKDFSGTINGAAKSDTHRFYINAIDQAEGLALNISIATRANSFEKTGKGSVTFTQAFTSEGDFTVYDGSLAINNTLTAQSVSIQGGATTITSATANKLAVSGTGDTSLAITNALTARDSIAISGGTVTIGSIAQASSFDTQLNITGGTLNVGANASLGAFAMTGGTATIGADLSAKTFSFNAGSGSLTITGDLTVTKVLGMNYNGTLDLQGDLELSTGAVLKYLPNAQNTLSLSLSQVVSGKLSLDLTSLSTAALASGVNLGIEYYEGIKNDLNVSTLDSYEIRNVNGKAWLYSSSSQSTIWDPGWGMSVIASAPAQAKDRMWSVSANWTGLYETPYCDIDNYYTAAILGGESTSSNPAYVYGGAYAQTRGSSGGDTPSGGTIDRQVWLALATGSFELVAGGSYLDATTLSSWNFNGDSHILLTSNAKVGSIVGGNVKDGGITATWTGDSYISINTVSVSGSVIGSSLHYGTDKTSYGLSVSQTGQHTHTGNVLININTPLTTNSSTTIADTLSASLISDRVQYINDFFVCGGSYSYTTGQTSTQNGNTQINVNINTTYGLTFVKDLVAGHYGQNLSETEIANENITTAPSRGTQVMTGNSKLNITANSQMIFNALAVGGSLNGTSQTQTGDSTVNINAANSTFTNYIVGGHTVLNVGNTAQTLTGSTYLNLATKTSSAGMVVGGFARLGIVVGTDDDGVEIAYPIQNNSTQTITGDTNINITQGQYRSDIVGGHYDHNDTESPGTAVYSINSSINGSANINIKNSSVSGAVVGGSDYFLPRATLTSNIGSIQVNVDGSTLSATRSLIGGYRILDEGTLNLQASVGDITLNLSNTTVSGKIYGGTALNHNYAPGDAIRGDLGVVQGAITLNLNSGAFNGDIYAAGGFVLNEDGDIGTTTMLTESTTVNIGIAASMRAGITVSGSYENNNGSLVSGNKTLAFTDSGVYNVTGIQFQNFDTVDVAAGGYVTLGHALQNLERDVTKLGGGTLALYQRNTLDAINVSQGTLKLAGNSGNTAYGTMIEQLTVGKDGTLDISSGTCGINGTLMLESGSTLRVDSYQTPASIGGAAGSLIWGGGENSIVNLDISNLPTESEYVIELFSDLTRDNITGLDMREIETVGYGTEASPYVNILNGALNNAYLVLREDGTLILTNTSLRGVYWEGGNAEWNNNAYNKVWSTTDGATPDSSFIQRDMAYFTHDDNCTITVTETVVPYSMYFEDGDYTFTGDGTVSTLASITLSEADVIFDCTLELSPTASRIVLKDNDSSLTVNNDLSINKLLSNGTVTIEGNLSMAQGTNSGGTLTVANLALGGDTTFTQLTAEEVTGNQGHTLSVGGASAMDSLDGGSLNVRNGSTEIHSATNLATLSGTGSLSVADSLTLAANSSIGNLTTPALTLSDRLEVSNTLSTDTITLAALRLNADQPMVQAGTAEAKDGNTIAVNVSEDIITRQVISDGVTYWMVKGDYVPASTGFTINGESGQVIQSYRYDYYLNAEENGVTIKGIVTNYDFYKDNALTENGLTGAGMMDYLYKDSSAVLDHPDGDLLKVINALNDLITTKGDKAAADTLNAAVAGSTISTLGMAFSGDIQRQLKAIRNRTTTMGLGNECSTYEDLPYFNAWVNAEGNHRELDADGTLAGYKLDSWGGTVGFDADLTPNFTAGLALTAMFGDYSASGADTIDGDFDTQYLTAFARYYKRAWVHTLVASVGRMDASLDRTVNIPGYGSYTTSGDTDGIGFGLMYEVGRVFALNRESTAAIQPVANITLAYTSISGYTETGSDAALAVDDMDATTLTFGVGARVQASVGENIYNRTSILEGRALAKFTTGDRDGEADVSFANTPAAMGTVKSAESGTVGLEIGAGLTIPVGAENQAIFADISAELTDGYTEVNGTIGYRINF